MYMYVLVVFIIVDKENLDRSETSFNEFDSPISGTPTSKTLQVNSICIP